MAEINNQCVGIMGDGTRCTRAHTRNSNRCGIHIKTLQTNGPNMLALKELGYVHKKQIRELNHRWHESLINIVDNTRIRHIHEDFGYESDELKLKQRREITELEREHRAEIARTGIDPDEPAIQRRRERAEIEDQRFREENRLFLEQHHANHNNNVLIEQQQILDQIQRQRGAGAPVEIQLREFVQHDQNVHRDPVVKMVNKTVEVVLKIPVPEEYRWNTKECSKTPGDIITNCKLTLKSACQMTAKYCQDDDIYKLGRGIYGKVLDSVWQYILKSESKEDLCKILKQEMEDNIGMCAQGNLTRLCNILSGYLEEIGTQESQSEILGRRLPKIMEIEGFQQRLDEAFKLFSEVNLPSSEWDSWLDPLIDNGGAESYSVEHVKNDDGVIIALKAVATHH